MLGFRVEGTVREFRKPRPVNIWFRWPCHVEDKWELLKDAKAAGEELPWERAKRAKQTAAKAERQSQVSKLDLAIGSVDLAGEARKVATVASEAGVSEVTLRKWIKKSSDWAIQNGTIVEAEK